ncbi:MAG: ABC transporter substrate-binding protein [Verrucomicrobia bacterium]|nr:ABC transporter substrate-binding protein [Verrucomicrobiota bacterium]
MLGLLLVACAGAGDPPPAPQPQPALRIGLLLPPTEADADSITQGAELAVRELASRGTKVELIVRGRPGQWGTEGDEAAVLVHEDRADAVLAPALGASAHQVLQVAGRTRVPVVSLCPDSSVTGPGIPWTLRIVPRSDEQARAIIAALPPSGSPPRVAAVVPPERAGREAARDLMAAAAAAGAELDAPIVWDAAEMVDSVAARVRALEPALTLLWVDGARAAATVKALTRARHPGRVAVHGGLVTPEFSAAVQGSSAEILAAVPAGFGVDREPAPNLTSALSADAVRLLAEVLSRAGSSPSFLQFPLTNSFAGVTGPLRFDRYGNRVLELAVIRWRAGRWQTVTASAP